jgi:hypothetical protein
MFLKFLRQGMVSPFTSFRWSTKPEEWVRADQTVPCTTGFHACRRRDLPYWLNDELWEIELAQPVIEAAHKVLAIQARLLHRVESWTSDTALALAEACVGRTVLHAVDELQAAGFAEQATRLAGTPPGGLSRVSRDIMESVHDRVASRLTRLCGYVDDASQLVGVYPTATIAYIAARAANQRSGPPNTDLYTMERDWQAQWLSDALDLREAS